MPGKDKSNKSATWQSCERCGLRLKYVTKGKATGESRAIGPPPDQVEAAQLELAQIYDVDQMNEKIFNGKLMELRGRRLVETRGRGRTTVQVRADEKLGEALMASTCSKGYTMDKEPNMKKNMPKAASKAAAAPSTPTRTTSPTPSTPRMRSPLVKKETVNAETMANMRPTPAPTVPEDEVIMVDSEEESGVVSSPEVPK